MKIFDLDGTLADLNHRLHFIKNGKKDWDGFFNACDKDKPIQWVINLCNKFNDVIILSGRSDAVREKTEKWLSDNGVRYSELIMRKSGEGYKVLQCKAWEENNDQKH